MSIDPTGEIVAADLDGGASPADPARRMAGMTSRVVRGSFWSFGAQVPIMLATLICTPFTIRLLGPTQYGVLALVNVVMSTLVFADFGMGTTSTRFASERHALGDDRGEVTAIWTSLSLAFVLAAVASLALIAGAETIVQRILRMPPELHRAAVITVRLAALAFLGRALAGVMNTPVLVRLRMDLTALINGGTAVGQIALVPLVILAGGGLTGAAATIMIAGVAAAALYFAAGARLLPALLKPRVDRSLVRPLLAFGGPVMISSIATMMLSNAEKLLLPRYASVSALAFYSVAYSLAFMLTQAPIALVQSLLPAFSQLQVNPDRSELRLLYHRALRGTLYWIAPASVFLCTVARPFFTFWAGPEYGRQSTLPLYILTAGVAVEVMAYVPYVLLQAMGRTGLIARCHVAMALPYLFVSAFLIHRFGAPGAAVAWMVRATTGATVFILFTKRVIGFHFRPLPEKKLAFGLALLCLCAPVLLTVAFSDLTILRLISALFGCGLYLTVLTMRVLDDDERRSLGRLVPSWRGPGE